MRVFTLMAVSVVVIVVTWFGMYCIEPTDEKSGEVISAEYLIGGIRIPATILKFDDGSTFVVNDLQDVTPGQQTIVRGRWRQDVRKWTKSR